MAKILVNRQTQEERREATRLRLIDATLHCLEQYGYAETTVSRIVAEARVSRGALLHHYASKNELILDAARTLLGRVFERLHMLLGADAPRWQPEELVERIWQEFFMSGTHVVYVEFLVASRRDKSLGTLLQSLAPTLEEYLRVTFAQHFVSAPNAEFAPHDIFLMTRWLLRGMAIDVHLLTDPQRVRHFLALWSRLFADQLRSANACLATQ
ncbi:MAG: TetR/AcrR family transcriptional regulator [Pirellulales bacterium]|nr:TetR/AcrR family transcriptional regulator [Pirellulales bacterium]